MQSERYDTLHDPRFQTLISGSEERESIPPLRNIARVEDHVTSHAVRIESRATIFTSDLAGSPSIVANPRVFSSSHLAAGQVL